MIAFLAGLVLGVVLTVGAGVVWTMRQPTFGVTDADYTRESLTAAEREGG